MAENEDKSGDNDEDEIQWIFSSPLRVIFGGIFVVCMLVMMFKPAPVWEWGMVIGAVGFCVFMVIDRRG